MLVVYALAYWPLRVSVEDHLYSIGRYSSCDVYYLNAIGGAIPSYLENVQFDAIIYHTTLLSRRWDVSAFGAFAVLARKLSEMSSTRIAMPQDEFINTESLERWLIDAKVDVVCSILKQGEWKNVYPRLTAAGVKFHQVLTGYLSDEFISSAEDAVRRTPRRDIDIGYRAWAAAAWLGRHGRLKIDIAGRVKSAAQEFGIATDISTESRDSISGFDWLLFLARCRYVLGVEGGASIHDKDGSVRNATEAFLKEYPEASFEQIEAACFPGRDGELDCRALSPRHLEACATRTAQILVEGEYNGLLQPDLHYLPLKVDFSNLRDVLGSIGNETVRREIADRAYRDVVQSGAGSYRSFVGFLDGLIGAPRVGIPKRAGSPRSVGLRLLLLRAHMKLLNWGVVVVWSVIAGIRRTARVLGYQIDSNDIISWVRSVLR